MALEKAVSLDDHGQAQPVAYHRIDHYAVATLPGVVQVWVYVYPTAAIANLAKTDASIRPVKVVMYSLTGGNFTLTADGGRPGIYTHLKTLAEYVSAKDV